MKFIRGIIVLLPALFLSCQVFSQAGTYILNGSAVQNSCNCYTLTPAVNTQSGSVWNATKINLNNSFDFVFNVFLGCTDANGADGMVFMLQPISTSVGTTGEGMGFEGITPSIGITLDTWQNVNRNDPAFDHISIQANGVVTHGSDLAGPVQASPTNPNIEDCQWHTLRIVWNPVTRSLSTYFDGFFMLESIVDLVATIFNNDPMVYWGFSAGTGGSNNLQQFCTALNPNFNATTTASVSCFGNPVTFTNTSQTFAPITSFFWDFGDNTTSTLANPPPHNYAAPGSYEVKMAITGLDGCLSDTLRKTIIVGDYPVADFAIYDTCAGVAPRLNELSQVTIGTINQWSWELDGIPVSISQLPQLSGLSGGLHQLQLVATSNYGCASTPVVHSFTLSPKPAITAQALDGCIDEPVSFTSQQTDNATTITQWNWQFGDNQTSTQQNPQHMYTSSDTYNVQVSAVSITGCVSDMITIPLFINQASAYAGNDTIIIKDIPFQLHGTGGGQYNWSPSLGLDNAAIAGPTAILQDDITYTVTVTTAEGCEDDDDIKITVFKGSAIYVPKGFTPNNDGLNDRLKPYYIGIKTLDYFTMYNRWGQTVFTTKDLSAGWNGIFKGEPQSTGTYVWVLKATDYVGKVYQMKGTSTIIR
jgi:gliding motility-associated-like protein